MRAMSMRCVDYLDWLKDQEEFLLYQLDLATECGNQHECVEVQEELQLVREIKGIVAQWEENNVN